MSKNPRNNGKSAIGNGQSKSPFAWKRLQRGGVWYTAHDGLYLEFHEGDGYWMIRRKPDGNLHKQVLYVDNAADLLKAERGIIQWLESQAAFFSDIAAKIRSLAPEHHPVSPDRKRLEEIREQLRAQEADRYNIGPPGSGFRIQEKGEAGPVFAHAQNPNSFIARLIREGRLVYRDGGDA